MGTIGERLLYFIENQNLDPGDFAASVELRNNTLKEITDNKRGIGVEVLKRIAEKYPNLSLNWLLLGIGSMLFTEYAIPNQHKVVLEVAQDIYGAHDPVEEMFLKYMDRPNVQEKLKEILKGK